MQHFLSSRLDLESDNLSRKSTAVAALDQLSAGTASFVIFTGLITVAIPVTVPVPRNEVACPLTLRFLLTIPVTHGGHRFALGSPRRPRGYRLATTGWYVTRVCFVWRILLSEWHDFMDAAGPLHSSQYSNGAVHCTVEFFSANMVVLSLAGMAETRVRRCSACNMDGHDTRTCPLVQSPKYPCVDACGQTTCTLCAVACGACRVRGHTEDMQSCAIPTRSRKAAKFVCEKHEMAAMHGRLRVILADRAQTPRQLKEPRARAKSSLAARAGESVADSHVAAHVARSANVDDEDLGGAAAQPRARAADAAIAAARDAGATPGGARLARALVADRARHGDRDVPAPPVAPAQAASAGGTVEEARAAALASMDKVFQSMQQPKFTPAKRKSMSDVLRTVGVHARRAGANAEIYGSENPFSIRSGVQLRAAALKFANITDPVIATQVRDTLNAFFTAPNHFYGQALTAESLSTADLVGVMMACADGAKLKTLATRAVLTQFLSELRRGNDAMQLYFKVSRRDGGRHSSRDTYPCCAK